MMSVKNFQAIFKLLPTPGLILLPDGPGFPIVAVNDAYLDLTNISEKELIGKDFTENASVKSSYQLLNWRKAILRVLKSKSADKISTELCVGLSTEHSRVTTYFELSNVPSLNENGEIDYIFCSFVDVTERVALHAKYRAARDELKRNEQLENAIVQNTDGVLWEMMLETQELNFSSEQVKPILGHSMSEWRSKPAFWKKHLHPHDREMVTNYLRKGSYKTDKFTFECRVARADGRYVWLKNFVSVIADEGKPPMLRGLMVDISEKKRLNDFEYFEKKILRLNAKMGAKVQHLLTAFSLGLEEILPEVRCAIHEVRNNRIYNWAAPSLPRSYINALDGLSLSKSVGSCGASSFLRQTVIVHDIENDLRWLKTREVALASNLRACWSYPVMNNDGEVMATLGLYCSLPKSPNEKEALLIQRANGILKIILENRIYTDRLQENTILMNQSQHLAKFGNWSWDVNNDVLVWSDTMYTIYGRDKRKGDITFESYLNCLHYEDKEKVSAGIGGVLSTKKGIEFEERIIRPDGEVRHLKSWCKVKLGENGETISLYGACLDITEAIKTDKKLLDNEIKLRSLVDSQTNFVIKVDFKGNYTYCNPKYEELFGWAANGERLVGNNCMKTVFSNHHQQVFDIAEQCLIQPDTVYQLEVDKIGMDGKVINTLWDFVCLTDERGNPKEIQGIGIDITAWKSKNEKLSERFQYADHGTNAMYDWDIQADHITWSDSYYVTYGHPKNKEKYPLERWAAEVHDDDADRILLALKEVLANVEKHSWFADYQFKKADGTCVWIEVIGHIIREETSGLAVRMVGVIRDISQRKASESKLNVLHEHYHDLFQHSPQPMWVYEVDTLKFVDVNEAAIKCYGYSREEFLSANTSMIKLAEDMHRYLQVMESANQEKSMVFQGVFRHQNKDGEVLHMDIRSNPIKVNDKETYLVLASDITDRLNYFEGIEKQNEKLKEIAWMQSHVVRAPLTRMMSLIDLLKNDETVNADNDQLFEYLLSSALELDEIVKDISVKTAKVD